jgi:hypothetical protein
MEDICITTEGIKKELHNLNAHKAGGPDGINPPVLKQLAEEIAPILKIIFESSLKNGAVPADWREANVTPIFKKGEHYDPANYRPVSLTSVCCKILEHIIVRSLMDHLDRNDILCEQQHGFRRGRSCETQLLNLVEHLNKKMAEGKESEIVVMDFAKAFDKVNHSLLTQKLHHYGVRGTTNAWITHFLENRQQAVVVDGIRSDQVHVKTGVPQGSVLGPCLFLVYINDLPGNITSMVRLFADDTALHRTVSTNMDQAVIQEDLVKLAEWEENWNMKFHPGKCNVLPVTRKLHENRLSRFDYELHGHVLETVENTKYLGVTISTDLSWDDHIDQITRKANSTLGFVRRNLRIGNTKIKELAYKTFVRPILEYACTVWDPHTDTNINKLEMVQRRAARFVLNNYHRTASVSAMIDYLKWPSLQERRKDARLTMFYGEDNPDNTQSSMSRT